MPIYTPFKKAVAVATFAATAKNSTGSQSSFTFSSVSIGTASADRKVVVSAATSGSGHDTTGVTGLTIGGTSATKAISVYSGSGPGRVHTELWYLNSVSSGTTADIVVTWNSSRYGMNIGTWAVTGGASGVNDTATTSSASGTLSTTIDCSAGGVVIGARTCDVSLNDHNQQTWTGLDNDGASAADGPRGASGCTAYTQFGSKEYGTAQSGLTVSLAPSGTINGQSLAVFSIDAA